MAEEQSDLIKNWRAGDPQAAAMLFSRYAERLTWLAEQHLSRKVAGRVDGQDVVQSAFRTFFRRAAKGEFQIDSSGKLWHLLVKITLLKARAKGRYHTAGMRNVNAEVDTGWQEALGHEPGPADAAALLDLIDTILRDRPALFREVLERRLQGESVTDIARKLKISRQSIYHILKQLQEKMIESVG
jgi:RNA polymerase sigma-70 factor (ECF subfamily)